MSWILRGQCSSAAPRPVRTCAGANAIERLEEPLAIDAEHRRGKSKVINEIVRIETVPDAEQAFPVEAGHAALLRGRTAGHHSIRIDGILPWDGVEAHTDCFLGIPRLSGMACALRAPSGGGPTEDWKSFFLNYWLRASGRCRVAAAKLQTSCSTVDGA